MYYDVHSHYSSPGNTGVISIQNIHQHFDKIMPQKPMSLGIHPWYIDGKEKQYLDEIKQQAAHANVWAIGECGIDINVSTACDTQKQLLKKQIDIATYYNKPLIIHCVRAFQDVLRLVKGLPIPVIFHGINNKLTIINPIIEQGHYLSFGKSLLNPTKTILESLRNTPLDQMLFETDDSKLPIEQIYEQASKILEIHEKTLVLQIKKNFKHIFSII